MRGAIPISDMNTLKDASVPGRRQIPCDQDRDDLQERTALTCGFERPASASGLGNEVYHSPE